MTTTRTLYDRAMTAEPRLRAIDAMVTALTTLTRPDDTMCSGCIWGQIVKPLAYPLVGWGRGYPIEQARENDDMEVYTLADLLAIDDRRIPAQNPTEEWMRTEEAWNVVTGMWLARLEAIDPGNGHGVKGCQ